MIRVAHLGPPLSRQGGPAGYLYQLERAARDDGWKRSVWFPPAALPKPAAAPLPLSRRVRTALGSFKRAVVGTAPPYRPSDESLAAEGGHVDCIMRGARDAILADAAASIAAAPPVSPDVWFCHDAPTAADALERRAPGQQVWLLLHNPMPLALYLVWNWGLPERHWRDILAFPDVRKWIAWELDVWRAVDRLVVPCVEALREIARVAPTAASVPTPIDFVLSGASADAASDGDRLDARRQWGLPFDQSIGLYIGNHQPYRGLDVLLEAARHLDRDTAPGIIAVAGPPPSHLPKHPRLRALGHVSRVADLLSAVDFVVNVNRFSLFDLSTIEALEAGKPLLLHATGGNVTFHGLGAGAEMLPDLEVETVADGLRRMFAMPIADRRRLEWMSRTCYDSHLTRRHMWERHRSLYDAPFAAATA